MYVFMGEGNNVAASTTLLATSVIAGAQVNGIFSRSRFARSG